MVKIRTITIGGFRNLKTTRLQLHDITALVASNNFGKSNLIAAFEFAFDFIKKSPETRSDMMRSRKGIPLTQKLSSDPFYFDVEIENDELDEHKYINYGFSFAWYNDKDKDGFITDEWIRTREKTSVKYTSYLKRNESKYRQGKDTASFKSIKLDEKVLAVDLLTLFTDEEISRVAGIIKGLRLSVCNSLNASSLFAGPPIEFSDKQRDSFGSNQIPKIMFDLKQEDSERYDSLIDNIFELFPEFQDIRVEYVEMKSKNIVTHTIMDNEDRDINANESDLVIPFKISDGIYRLMIKSQHLNQSVNADMMSAGTKRIIWLLVQLFSAQHRNTSLVAIEEIETSIHPKLLKNLLEIIDDLSRDVNILLTSHSPLLIQYLKPESLYIGTNDVHGCATFSPIKPTKISQVKKTAQSRGMSIGEFIFDTLSKDIESSRILNAILEDSND